MKKLYNNTLLQLILALCTFSFVACQEFDIDSQPEGPLNIQIDALESYTALATSPSNIVFNISSNTPWTIESDQQWCKPTPSMSAASSLVSEIVVMLENNVGKQKRTARLTIKAEGIEGTKVVTIEQASKEDLVVIRPTDIVPTEGGVVSFNIISNKPWEIITTTQFLENIDKTSGTGNENGEKENITITVPPNTGAIRSAEITVKTAFQEETFTITQDGIVIETKNEEDAVNNMSGMGAEKIIEINSSVEWKVEIPTEYKEWLSAEADGNQLKLSATFNNLFVQRTGYILLYPKMNVPGFEGVPIEVTQPRNISLNRGEETIDPVTGYATIQSKGVATRFAADFGLRKGKIVWEFDKVDIPDSNGSIEFNGDTWSWGNGGNSVKFWLKPESSEMTTSFEEWYGTYFKLQDFNMNINDIRTVAIEAKDDPNNEGKVCFIVYVNEQEVTRQDNKTDIYINDSNFGGHQFYFGFEMDTDQACTLTFKSINYESYE